MSKIVERNEAFQNAKAPCILTQKPAKVFASTQTEQIQINRLRNTASTVRTWIHRYPLSPKIFFCDRDPLRFSIDIYNRHRPERNQIDSGHEFAKERRQKFPVPAKKVNQHGSNTKIEQVINRRCSTLNK